MTWRVHLHPDVIRYLYGLRERGINIRQAIAQIEAGPPEDARETMKAGFYLWIEERHWILFRVEVENQAIYITGVDPIEENKP